MKMPSTTSPCMRMCLGRWWRLLFACGSGSNIIVTSMSILAESDHIWDDDSRRLVLEKWRITLLDTSTRTPMSPIFQHRKTHHFEWLRLLVKSESPTFKMVKSFTFIRFPSFSIGFPWYFMSHSGSQKKVPKKVHDVGPGGPPSARSRRAGAEDGRQTDTWRWGCHMSGVFMGI